MISAASAAVLLAAASPALAQSNEITVGVTISATGPAAALGIPIKNTIELLPTEIGGMKVKVIQLDDAGDSTTATTNARRLITESKIDVLIGSSTTPPTIAVSTVAT
jgi:branched-chain amino acid transport system substrate-binding protein